MFRRQSVFTTYLRPLSRVRIRPAALVVAIILFGSTGLVLARNSSPNDPINLNTQQWQYLPGSSLEADGLHIIDSDFKIVEQDGSGGQPNPPVNLYGPHLAVRGNFSVVADMKQINGVSDLQLYGSAPIVSDEFRVEPPSLRLRVSGSTLTVSIFDGADNVTPAKTAPIVNSQYPIQATKDHHIEVAHKGKQLVIGVDGKAIATLDDQRIFKKNTVWFGAANSGGSYVLTNLIAQAQNGGQVKLIDTRAVTVKKSTAAGTTNLQALATAKRPGFLIGAAVALAPLTSDTQYRNVALGGNFGSFTTENALKWQFTEPKEGNFDFHEGDAILAQAQQNGIVLHGHTLVFAEANPAWVTGLPTKTAADKARVKQVMTNHITAVMGHYKGQIPTWDVVNEPLADYNAFDAGGGQIIRDSVWSRAMGQDYIATALNAAHAADPKASLYINDYGLEADGDRWDAFLALVTNLKQQGVPLDGVGFESHVYTQDDVIDPAVLQKHIQLLSAIGLKSRVSEIDVYSDDGQAAQAAQYATVLQACLAQPSCVSYTTWGITDRYDLFQDDNLLVQQGQDLLWNASVRPTPAVSALRKVLR